MSLIATALLMALPFAMGSWWLIGAAWAACDEAEPGSYFALTFGYLPVLIGFAWTVFVGSLGFARRVPVLIRLIAGAILASVVCVWVIAMQVPAYGEEFYGWDPATAELPYCGPGGIPTSWPSWLPR